MCKNHCMDDMDTVKKWLQTKDDADFAPCLDIFRRMTQHMMGVVNMSSKHVEIDEVVTEITLRVQNFDMDKQTSLKAYIFIIIRNYLFNVVRRNNGQKRDERKTMYLADCPKYDADDEQIDFDVPAPIENVELLSDAEFLKYYCGWWRTNGPRILSKTIAKRVETIVDVIEHPEKHDLMNKGRFHTQYLAKLMKMSKQNVSNLYGKMRQYSPQIVKEYMGESSP